MAKKRLLRNASRASHLISDATYQLILEKNPCITIGTSDRDKRALDIRDLMF